jgi:hypothetical protein
LREHGLDEILVDAEPMRFDIQYVVYDEGVIEKSSEEDMAWAPIVSLLQAVPHLEDLIYDCQSQFPPSLLSTLHEQHPQCRLHHLTFKFRTLLRGFPYPYEMELATSPSLHRLRLIAGWRDTDGDDDFNREAVMELAAGLAPNLKDITILNLNNITPARLRGRPRELWHGLPGYTSKAVGSLTSLSLKGYSSLESPTLLHKWARHTDFACLKQLTLGECYQADRYSLSGETMKWVAENCSFPQLRALSVFLTRNDVWHEKPQYTENAISFFQTFTSLEDLSIHGPVDIQIMNAILSHHGQSLKKLNLHISEEGIHYYGGGRERREIPMDITKDQILQIQAQCPILEHLTIPIKRNQSLPSETELYKCFSQMQNLRYLFLILDCSNWRVTRDTTYTPHFNEEDQTPLEPDLPVKRGNLKETIINCAVDEALARSIWKTISQEKSGRRLQQLRLWTKGASQYGTSRSYIIPYILQPLSRSWLIERGPREDREDVLVKELGRRFRESRVKRAWRYDARVSQIFRTIWPCKEGSEDWIDGWSSFPLCV